MQRQALTRKKLPDAPGVYFFLGARRKILYIGRATSLRNRVRSYSVGDILESRSPWIAKMLPLVRSIDFRKTDSVLEAVLLEADLIKKFQPKFNTDEKDDKSYNCVVITKEDFPAVFVERQKNIELSSLTVKGQRSKVHGQKLLAVYGPFPSGLQLQTAMKIIRRIFPYRDQKCTPCSSGKAQPYLRKVEPCRPCFNRQIRLCPGTCTGEIRKAEYARVIRNLRLFFRGKKAHLMALLKKEMQAAAKAQEFEKAGELKWQLFALKHIQDVALLKATDNPAYAEASAGRQQLTTDYRIEAYDLSHFGGKQIVGAMTVVTDGRATPAEYRLFKIRSVHAAHETASLKEVLRRRFNHPEWPYPNLIVVDGNEVQKQAAEAELARLGQRMPVVAVVKDEKHRPRDVIGIEGALHPRLSVSGLRSPVFLANSEAHRFALKFQRKQGDKMWRK